MKSFLPRLIGILKYLAIYYLSAKMICFAIPKFLHMQFRLLHYQSYTPLVELSQYEHMWSFFGRSYNYNLFIGLAEFLIGALIVFRRTRLIALLVSLAVCSNILILNIEFDISFALQHAILDLVLTLLLLSSYRSDLYRFFVQLGGKFEQAHFNRNIFQTWFPWGFVIVVSVGYFLFARHLKATVNDELVGAYEIRSLRVDDIEMELGHGALAEEPMLFLEYNSQAVLSMHDTLYMGSYAIVNDSIRLGFHPSKLGLRGVQGVLEKASSFSGKTYDGRAFRMELERIKGNKNYLNEVYR